MPRALLLTLYLAVVAIWGTTWIAIKTAVATVPPITASGLRFAIAFPVLALIIARLPGTPLRYPRGRRRVFLLVTLGLLRRPLRPDEPGQRGRALRPGRRALRHGVRSSSSSSPCRCSAPAITGRQAAGVGVALAALAALIANQIGLGGEAHPSACSPCSARPCCTRSSTC